MKSPYIIMAPPYRHNSAGVRVLYELRRILEEHGYEAQIAQVGEAPPESIVIYPETVSGNPMKAKRVVRFVLNTPGLLGGDKKYDPDELVFTYLKRFCDAPVLTVPCIEDFFRDEHLPRSGACFWNGKGINVPRIPETGSALEITYDWPADRRSLARLFNEKEIFYSYDDCTALIVEARRSGCRVVVIPDEKEDLGYEDSVLHFEMQLKEFIRITQKAAKKELKISFGVLTNHPARFDMALRQSEISGEINFVINPESATKGMNELLILMEAEGSDVAVLTHQDMSYRRPWLFQIREQLAKLPDSWIVAGIIGKDIKGRVCGVFQDMRIPTIFNTVDQHTFPQAASCFDECCILINLRKGFRFDETLDGFDLYGTLCVLQTWEMGGTAWIIDSGAIGAKIKLSMGEMKADIAFAQHHCTRSFNWFPDQKFRKNFKWLHERFKNMYIDSTVLAKSEDPKLETSAI